MNLRIPHNGWVVVCDARKAMFLRNEGDANMPKLKVEQVKQAAVNPPSSEQGTDRPGRMQNAIAPTSATEGTDWHELAEKQFARDTVAALKLVNRAGRPGDIVLVAPPRILAVIRQNLDDDLRSRILAEVDKDLTKHPTHEIGRLLTGA
ncbi:host attachment protein [Bosea sp. RAF48]|uniref:host attachment protein n=1 Tax=Bosea sp. RAF48 TaxID=3237480 RepID=UPI003F8E012E